MSQEQHEQLLKAWKESWEARGWETMILTAQDARKHKDFGTLEKKLISLEINEYNRRCYWRWLAMVEAGGGWISDYDVFPLELTAELGAEMGKNGTFKAFDNHVPSLIHASSNEWDRVIHLMMDLLPNKRADDTVISDMYSLLEVSKSSSKNSIVWSYRVKTSINYTKGSDSLSLDCSKYSKQLAIHFSHHLCKRAASAQVFPLANVTIDEAVARRAEAALLLMDDYRNCQDRHDDEHVLPKKSLRSFVNYNDTSVNKSDVYFRVIQSMSTKKNNSSNPNITAPTPPILVEVINARNPENYEYTVTISSNKIYTGTALQVKSTKHNATNSFRHIFRWIPSFPGEYKIFVHQVLNGVHKDPLNRQPTPLVSPSPLSIIVGQQKGGGNVFEISSEATMERIEDRIRKSVPCQTVNRVDAYSKWSGDWVGPDTPFQDHSIRTGWRFLPRDMGCHIESFSRRDLLSISKKKSIWVLGTSVFRGVFLSLVDLILSPDEKEELSSSVIGKCWGRALIKKGNLELVYQDFRAQMFEPFGSPKVMECHNEKIAKDADDSFIQNAADTWVEMFRDKDSWPDVIFMFVLYDNVGHGRDGLFFTHLEHFMSKIPPSWNGTLLLADRFWSAIGVTHRSYHKYHLYLEEINEMVHALNDTRVRWLDGMGISREMVMYSEYGPDGIGASQHFHGFCDVPYLEDMGQNNTMRVCGNVTEILGQLLLSHALGTKKQFDLEKLEEPKDEALEYCHACPLALTPFKLVAYPEVTCSEGKLHPRNDDEVYSFKAKQKICPQWCLEHEVDEVIPSQSDMINIRRCKVDLADVTTSSIESASAAKVKSQVTPAKDKPTKPIMHTFFESVVGGCCGMSQEQHEQLLKAWKESWEARGWETMILTAQDARKHKDFGTLEKKLISLEINEYNRRCYWRWLAMVEAGGGWISDYDVFPLELTAELGAEMGKNGTFKAFDNHVPSLIHASSNEWDRVIHLMMDLLPNKRADDTVISDMYSLLEVSKSSSKNSIVWSYRVKTSINYTKGSDSLSLDCSKYSKQLAIHFSHHLCKRAASAQVFPLANVTIDEAVARRAEAALLLMDDYRNCQAF